MAAHVENESKVLTAQKPNEKQKDVPGIDWQDSTLSGVNLALTAIIQVVSYAPVPYLKQAASVALIIVNLTQSVKDNKKLFKQLVDDVTGLITAIGRSYIESEDRGHWINQELESNLAYLVNTLEDIHQFTQKKTQRKLKTRIFHNKSDALKIRELRSNINMAVSRFDIQSHLHINGGLITVAENLEGHKDHEVVGVEHPLESTSELKNQEYIAAMYMAQKTERREEREEQEREEREREEREEQEEERQEAEALAEQERLREEEEAEKRRTEAKRRSEERKKAEAKKKAEEETARLEEEEARRRAEERKAEARRRAEEERIRLEEEEREERKRQEARRKREEEQRRREEEDRQKAEDLKRFLAQKAANREAANKRTTPPTRKNSDETEEEENSTHEQEDDDSDSESATSQRKRPKPKRRAEPGVGGHFESTNGNSGRPGRMPNSNPHSYSPHEPQYPPGYPPQSPPFYHHPHSGYYTPPQQHAPPPFGMDLNAMFGSAMAGGTVMNIGSGNVTGNVYRNVNNTGTTKPRRRRRRHESDSDSDADYSDDE